MLPERRTTPFFVLLRKDMIKEKFISAVIGTLFFAVFQPFGMAHFGMWERLLISGGLFVTSFAACLASEAITTYVFRLPHPSSHPELVKSDSQYMFKRSFLFQIFNVIFLTVLISLFLNRFVNNQYVDNSLSIEKTMRILVVSIGCCVFIGVYWRNVYWKRHYALQLKEAQLLNGVLLERARQAKEQAQAEPSQTEQPSTAEQISLESSTKERLSLCISDFLFAESSGNYVVVHHIVGDKEEQTMLRTSMKSVASRLCTYSDIMQCHRAYIVNLSQVESVEGRSSGIGLRLRCSNAVVPVSKSYVSEAKERIQNPSRSSQK